MKNTSEKSSQNSNETKGLNPNRVTVKKNADTGEWMAVVYIGGVKDEGKTYYTDCKKDAEDTAFLIGKEIGAFESALASKPAVQRKTFAQATLTGRYFNGRAFEAESILQALELPQGTEAESFRLSWSCEVRIVTVTAQDFEVIQKSRAEIEAFQAGYRRQADEAPAIEAHREEVRHVAASQRRERSLALRIVDGEITPAAAAKEFIRTYRRAHPGYRSFLIFNPWTNRYVSRIPTMPKGREAAWVRINGDKRALVWNRGELAIG